MSTNLYPQIQPTISLFSLNTTTKPFQVEKQQGTIVKLELLLNQGYSVELITLLFTIGNLAILSKLKRKLSLWQFYAMSSS